MIFDYSAGDKGDKGVDGPAGLKGKPGNSMQTLPLVLSHTAKTKKAFCMSPVKN